MPRINKDAVVYVYVSHDIVPVEVEVASGGSRDASVSLWVGHDVQNHSRITIFVWRANIAVDARRDGGSRAGTFQEYGGRTLTSSLNLH